MAMTEAERALIYRERKKAQPFADLHFSGERMVTALQFLEAIKNIDTDAFLKQLKELNTGELTEEFSEGLTKALNKAFDESGLSMDTEEGRELANETGARYATEDIGLTRLSMEMSRYDIWTMLSAFKNVQKLP